jgi:alpha-L-rhamnosidase
MLIESLDGGNGWSAPRRLPAGIWGPIRNKPVTLTDGTLLCPSSTEHRGWRVHLEWTRDAGRSWDSSGPLEDDSGLRAIQPTLLRHPAGRLQLLCRTKRNCIAESWSDDAGRTWGTLRATTLPNPNSAIDAVTLRDGRHLLVYNHNKRRRVQWGGPRTPLALALSDDGVEWRAAGVLDQGKGEYSYPAVIQAADGQVHVLYSWRRERIRHVVIDPAALQRGPDVSAVHCGGAVGSDLHLGLSRPPWEEKPP